MLLLLTASCRYCNQHLGWGFERKDDTSNLHRNKRNKQTLEDNSKQNNTCAIPNDSEKNMPSRSQADDEITGTNSASGTSEILTINPSESKTISNSSSLKQNNCGENTISSVTNTILFVGLIITRLHERAFTNEEILQNDRRYTDLTKNIRDMMYLSQTLNSIQGSVFDSTETRELVQSHFSNDISNNVVNTFDSINGRTQTDAQEHINSTSNNTNDNEGERVLMVAQPSDLTTQRVENSSLPNIDIDRDDEDN